MRGPGPPPNRQRPRGPPGRKDACGGGYLRMHVWSTLDILRQVMQVKSRQAAHNTLRRLEWEQLTAGKS